MTFESWDQENNDNEDNKTDNKYNDNKDNDNKDNGNNGNNIRGEPPGGCRGEGDLFLPLNSKSLWILKPNLTVVLL